MTADRVDKVWAQVDTDGDGQLDIDELAFFISTDHFKLATS